MWERSTCCVSNLGGQWHVGGLQDWNRIDRYTECLPGWLGDGILVQPVRHGVPSYHYRGTTACCIADNQLHVDYRWYGEKTLSAATKAGATSEVQCQSCMSPSSMRVGCAVLSTTAGHRPCRECASRHTELMHVKVLQLWYTQTKRRLLSICITTAFIIMCTALWKIA